MKTKQEIFNAVWQYFIVEKHPQAADGCGINDKCYYRLPNVDGGFDKCAVGCIIPDELYDPEMESLNACQLMIRFPKVGALLGYDNVSFLRELQSIHDNSGHVIQEFKSRLSSLAIAESLNIPQ